MQLGTTVTESLKQDLDAIEKLSNIRNQLKLKQVTLLLMTSN